MTPGKALPLAGSPQPCDAEFHQGPMHSSEIHEGALRDPQKVYSEHCFHQTPPTKEFCDLKKNLKTPGSRDGQGRGVWGNEAEEAGARPRTNHAEEPYVTGHVPGTPPSSFLIVSR